MLSHPSFRIHHFAFIVCFFPSAYPHRLAQHNSAKLFALRRRMAFAGTPAGRLACSPAGI
jgi:hypothetical protein